MATSQSWVVYCKCCCSDDQVHYEYDQGTRMRCCTCACIKDKPTGEEWKGFIAVRVILRGGVNLKLMEEASTLARALGSEDEVVLKRANNSEHYLDVPAEALLSRLEIARLTGSTKSARARA